MQPSRGSLPRWDDHRERISPTHRGAWSAPAAGSGSCSAEALPETLRVRPVTGSDEDQTLIHAFRSKSSRYAKPVSLCLARTSSAGMIRPSCCATPCCFRCGGGPVRSGASARSRWNHVLTSSCRSSWALKLDPVRLLIADDVGVGKTIEALLIARELLDRGDIDRTVVLCPPHLVDQWITELEVRFHIRAVARHRPQRAAPGAGHSSGRQHLHGSSAHGRKPRLRENPGTARQLPQRVPRLRDRGRSPHLRLLGPGSTSALRTTPGIGRQPHAPPRNVDCHAP